MRAAWLWFSQMSVCWNNFTANDSEAHSISSAGCFRVLLTARVKKKEGGVGIRQMDRNRKTEPENIQISILMLRFRQFTFSLKQTI